MTRLSPFALCIAMAMAGCGGESVPEGGRPPTPPGEGGVAGGGTGGTGDPGETGSDGVLQRTCADLFAQDLLPTYRVEIAPEEWAALEAEFLLREEREQQGLDVHPWHPIVFRYGEEVVDTAMIRLKGNSSWLLAVERDPDPKMQFVISFNELDRRARFHGLRKIVLDMPRNDTTFLRQRLALSFLRDLELPAQCANSARLEINGAYYGLYTNMEAMDREFLRRVFPGEDDGDLWEAGRELKTNEETSDRARRDALYAVSDVEAMDRLADLEASIRSWSSEAMMPDSDGYYGGTLNFYLYDHPSRGFFWISHDLDGTFDFRPFDFDPLFWRRSEQPAKHYLLVLSEPAWVDRYVDALENALEAYDVQRLEKRVDDWSRQVAAAAEEDPNRPFSLDAHERSVARLRAFFGQRAAFIRRWIDCRRGGGEDLDGDGAAWCFDCAAEDASVHPGAGEVCGNLLDDDCDGRIDEGC